MNISFHTGKTAMIAQSQALAVYANNMANINTVGYQTMRPDFADCIYESYRRDFVDSDEDGENDILEPDWQTGHGAYVQKTDLMFSQSHFYDTDRELDFAIAGEGFFAVQDRWGNVNYTRDGAFAMTQVGDNNEWWLVSASGEYVLDENKQRIQIPFVEGQTKIDASALKAAVGVFEFPNPFGLEALGTNRYAENGKSGAAVANPNAEKLQSTLIASNVDLATQMVKLIETQRAYQISSRVVTTSDELARIANNLR